MAPGITLIGTLFYGVSVLVFLVTVYANMEGNRVTATRLVFHDIRRDMRREPLHRVWWRAFRIAMGWRTPPALRRDNVTYMRAPRDTRRA